MVGSAFLTFPALAATDHSSAWNPDEVPADARAWTPTLSVIPQIPPLLWALIAAVACAALALWIMGVIRPGGLEKHERSVEGSPALLWLGGTVVVLAAQMVGSAAAFRFTPQGDPTRSQAIATLGGGILAIATGVLLAQVALLTSPKSGLQPRWGDIRRGVIAFLMVAPFTIIASQLSQMVYAHVVGRAPDAAGHTLLVQFQDDPRDPWIWAMLGAAVVLGPIVEELMYRAFMQSGFLRLVKRRWAAVILTSIIFVAMHHLPGRDGPAVPWHGLPPLAVLSLGMGIAFERTGRIGVPILMHMLFNGANVAFMVWMLDKA